MKLYRFRSLTNSFNVRIIGITLLLLASTTMALNYYFYVRATKQLHLELLHHSQSLVQNLVHNSRVGVFTANTAILRTNASLLAADPDCQMIFFLDDIGALILQHPGKAEPPASAIPVSVQDILHEISDHDASNPFFFWASEALVMVAPVLADPQFSSDDLFFSDNEIPHPSTTPKGIGYVALVISTVNHQEKARAMFIHDTAITSVVTLISCLIILIIIYVFTTPLRLLTREILRHNPGYSPSPTPSDSIPSDFSHMIAMIRKSYQTITDLNNTLEEKVHSRTRQLAASNKELTIQKEGLEAANQKLAIALTKLESTQAQLVQSEKMAALGMLIAGLSHEIKNSINFIACAVPLLKRNLAAVVGEQLPPGETIGSLCAKSMPLLSNIQEGVLRTVRVIDDLALFSHDSGAGFAPTDIRPGIRSSVAILRREYGRRIEIIEDHAPDLPLIQGRAGQLNQVFINILLNAAHAIVGKGAITVRTWAEAETVHVSVTDTGHGIKDQNLNRIYDPFFTTKEVGQGTGLGLSISYSIVKSHEGDLKVTSKPGVGATFEVILPIKRNQASS